MAEPDRETGFSMLPPSVRRSLLCGDCVRLLDLLDGEQGDRGRPLQGLTKAAAEMTWQARTAKKHLRHLEAVGLVTLEPSPSPRGAWGHVRFRVVHNPARGRYSDRLAEVPGVWEDKPGSRWKAPSKLHQVTNARRDAPSVVPPETSDLDHAPMRRDAPSVVPPPVEPEGASRLEAGRVAPRPEGASRLETGRDAPSVASSLSRVRSCRSGEPEQPPGESQHRDDGSGSRARGVPGHEDEQAEENRMDTADDEHEPGYDELWPVDEDFAAARLLDRIPTATEVDCDTLEPKTNPSPPHEPTKALGAYRAQR
jgi:hypothetical protein